jgi:hypothetical protein
MAPLLRLLEGVDPAVEALLVFSMAFSGKRHYEAVADPQLLPAS